MGYLSNYVSSFGDKKRYYKGVSLFALWDRSTKFPKRIYLAAGAQLNETIVGDYTRIRQFTTIHKTTIGKYCSISRNVRIGLAEHPTNLISTNSIFYRRQVNEIRSDWVRPIQFEERKQIDIGNDVWIGEFSSIKGGVKVGDGAVIAARALVTKDVPPYAIVAGIPAKVIKYRFNDEIINHLLKIKWWNLPEREIEEKLKVFTTFNISTEGILSYFPDRSYDD